MQTSWNSDQSFLNSLDSCEPRSPTLCSPERPGGAPGKESSCRCSRCWRQGFDPWVGKLPWRRAWRPPPVFSPGESHGQRSLAGCGPQACRVGHNWSNLARKKTTGVLFSDKRNKQTTKKTKKKLSDVCKAPSTDTYEVLIWEIVEKSLELPKLSEYCWQVSSNVSVPGDGSKCRFWLSR